MTDKELLHQAVSLLNLIDDESICDASHHSLKDRHELGEACPILERHKNLFEAIKARLAQPEETVNGWPLYSGLPQPEPVAWQVKFRDDDGIPQIAWFPHPVHPESNLAKRPYIEEPLYTAPTKKEWVGLTDGEIDECDWGQSEKDFARAIEAKLKEKNSD